MRRKFIFLRKECRFAFHLGVSVNYIIIFSLNSVGKGEKNTQGEDYFKVGRFQKVNEIYARKKFINMRFIIIKNGHLQFFHIFSLKLFPPPPALSFFHSVSLC